MDEAQKKIDILRRLQDLLQNPPIGEITLTLTQEERYVLLPAVIQEKHLWLRKRVCW